MLNDLMVTKLEKQSVTIHHGVIKYPHNECIPSTKWLGAVLESWEEVERRCKG
jgi:hypothetical protein